MQSRHGRRHFQDSLQQGQQQIADFGSQAERDIDTFLFKRFGRLAEVRRFTISWLLLLIVLIAGVALQNLSLSGYYQTLRSVPGGVYNEGVLGRFTNANPLYATSDVDTTVSQLLFSGLFTIDEHGHLVGDLARDYSTDTHGTVYTVHLKPHLTWHDGTPLTSNDVLFTYQSIQNPDAQSPLQSSWQGIKVAAPDPLTVTFTLPGPLASFAYTLTNGIVPRHVLATVPAADLRSADFNTIRPVGSGPFMWHDIQVSGDERSQAQVQIALVPFQGYHGGKPKLQEFIVHAYASQDQLLDAFRNNQLTAVEGLTGVPADIQKQSDAQTHSLILRAETMVFFKTSTGVLANQKVRQALVQAANVPEIVSRLGYVTRTVREPFLTGQLGYDPAYAQTTTDLAKARALLDADGWVVGKDGTRQKDGKPLTFTLTATDTPDYRIVGNQLVRQWQALGAQVKLQLQSSADFQPTLAYHSYDAVLYGVAVGVDPDVFVYWDSSQADIRSNNRLNLSEYKNTTADTALEAGRTRLDAGLRTVKYKPFLQSWQQDAPALGLYQPRLVYITRGPVAGLRDVTINKASDRFNNVQNWEIRQAKVTNN